MLSLFNEFKNIIVLDTETTGISHKDDEIIELALLRVQQDGESFRVCDEYDRLIKLSPGRALPPEIEKLTGISEAMLREQGVEKQQAGEALRDMLLLEKPLLVAYNAQFDLCFLYYFLSRLGMAEALKNVRLLDALTVYKDRRAYPHKLCNAIEAYELHDVQNSHRAIDDTRAAFSLLMAMAEEKDDLLSYINLFGFIKKYGVSGPRISSVKYLPQGFEPGMPLYMQM